MNIDNAKSVYGLNTRATPIGPYSTGTIQVGPSNTTTSYPTADVAYVVRGIAVGSGDELALNLMTGSTSGSTSFVAGVAQVETATVVATDYGNGDHSFNVTVTATGMAGSPKSIPVQFTLSGGIYTPGKNAETIATAIKNKLNLDADYSTLFTATSSGPNVITTRKHIDSYSVPGGSLKLYAANDTALNISIPTNIPAEITAAPTSTNTTAGVASSGVKLYGQGADFEGEALPTIITIYGALFEVSKGSGVIAGSIDDLTPYSIGSVVQWLNPNGLPNETALTITPSSLTDISITVIGKTT